MKLNLTARWFVFGFLLLSIPPILALPAPAQIGVGVSVRIGPPALPVYEQPLCPGPGYLWTPGYWAWDDVDGYYWVPGTSVVAPVGLLWTPGYWGWNDDVYAWNAGYGVRESDSMAASTMALAIGAMDSTVVNGAVERFSITRQ